jgi:hypothetical protein
MAEASVPASLPSLRQLRDVMEQLGHSQIALTANTYGHIFLDRKKKLAAASGGHPSGQRRTRGAHRGMAVVTDANVLVAASIDDARSRVAHEKMLDWAAADEQLHAPALALL